MWTEVVVAEFLLNPETEDLLGENEEDVKPLDRNATRPSQNALHKRHCKTQLAL